jgi:enamine deaminase RidA (YjgF/YER057c/UK114 family)
MDMVERQEYRVDGLGEPISHYTDAVRWGDLLFMSGVVATDEEWNLIGGDDPTKQARALFVNMGMILKAAGARPEDVLKVTVYLTDVDDRTSVDIARKEFFGPHRPASTLIEVSRLAHPRWKVEVDAVAGIPS